MATELQNTLNALLYEKATKIIPENIKSGVKVLGVEGTLTEGIDTSDANAEASDILLNKTAYVGGKKIIGTAPKIDSTYETITDSVQTVALKNINARLICVVNGYSITLQNKILKVTNLVNNTSTEIACDLTGDYIAVDAGCLDHFGEGTMIISVCQGTVCYIYLCNYKDLTLEYKSSFTSSELSVNGLYFPAVNPHRPYISISLGIYGSSWGAPGTTIFKINNDFTLTIAKKVPYLAKSGSSAIYVQIDRWLNDYIFDIMNDSGYSSSSLGGDVYTRDGGIYTKYFLDDETLAVPADYQNLMTANNSNTLVCYYKYENSSHFYEIKTISKDGSGTMNVGNTLYKIEHASKSFARFLADDIILIGNIIYKLDDGSVTVLQQISGTINHINRYNSLILNGSTLNWFLTEGTKRLVSVYYNNSKILNNTDDATALASHILQGETAYVNEVKVKGTMPNNGTLNYNSSQEDQIIPEGYTAGGTIKAVTSSIDENIKAENIKEGVSILGITGTLSGEASTEGVKLFKTVSLMNNDTNPVLGDLAVVYSNENKNIEGSSQFSKCICPQEVVLDTPITDMDYLDLSFKAVDSSYTLDCYGTLDPTMFYLTIMNGYDYIDITYSSSDGITYTRTDSGSDEVDFGTLIQYSYPEYFDERIGYFFQIQEALFNGLYKYNGTSYVLAESQISALPEYVYKKIFYGATGVQTGNLGTPDNTLIDVEAQLYSDIIKTYHKMPEITMDNDTIIDKNIILLPSRFDGTSVVNTSSITNLAEKFKDCNKLLEVGNIDTSNVTDMRQCFHWCNSLYSIGNLNTSKVTNMSEAFAECTNLVHIGNLDTSNVNNMSGIFEDCSNLKYIPKLNTMKAYYMNSAFCGCYNLISVADVTLDNVSNIAEVFSGCKNLQSLPLLNITKATNMAYSFKNCRQLKDINITNTVNATNMAQAFADCVNLVDVPNIVTNKTTDVGYLFMNCTNLTSIPALNFNNVTNAPLTFANCTNLVEISSLNFSKTINVPGLYQNCTNLTSIPVTSYPNAKDVSSMFAKCTNLTSIPSLNVINATSAYFLFDCCTNLTASPTMNLHKATYIRYLFNNCTNLKDIPSIINICNATEAQKIFNNCPNLTNTALNNVLGSLQTLGSNYSGTKSLAYIGLSNTQAEICTTLSNWTSLNSKGWVTGY